MKSILLIGLNRFGSLLAKELHDLGHEVMAVDRDEQRVNEILPIVTGAQIGDSTNETFLRSLGVSNYDVCFVTIGGDFQSSLETTSLLKELGGKVVVSLHDERYNQILSEASVHSGEADFKAEDYFMHHPDIAIQISHRCIVR